MWLDFSLCFLTTAKPPQSVPAPQRPRQANRRKRGQQQTSTHPHTGPASILLSDTTMTPWGGLALSESSFTAIPPPPPPRPVPPPPPPAPQPTPSTPYQGRVREDASDSTLNSEAPSPLVALPQEHAGMTEITICYELTTAKRFHWRPGGAPARIQTEAPDPDKPFLLISPCASLSGGAGRGFRHRRRVLPQRRVPHPPRLPPLRPVTNHRVSRSFTFSFFELPPHQSPRHRAERVKNLMLLLRQIHY